MQLNKLLRGLVGISIAAAVCGAQAQTANTNNPYTEGSDAAKIQDKPTSKAKNKAAGTKKKAGHEGEAQVSGPSGTVTRDTTAASGSSGTTGSTAVGASGAAGSTESSNLNASGAAAAGATAGATPVTGTSTDVGGSAGTAAGATTGTTGTGNATVPPTRQ